GHYPPTLDALYDRGYVQDRDTLRCTKTGQTFAYHPPQRGAPRDTVIASCVDPATPKPDRPHGFGGSICVLCKNGRVEERQ
ncbi:MAG: hypothetical protein ACE5O2_04300, partial [Armatimonadota bacterium]